ncbi:hypothetical protein ABEV54_08765 [Peribacillus psychrosaccharolyticus]|uniref:hypothetical protein n=1 Tax=Peribacillus psychrosaccharolyticus TaxID=1407 RepID=UPI003D274515
MASLLLVLLWVCMMVFIVMFVIAVVKKTGKAKRYVLYSIGSLVLMFIVVGTIGTTEKSTTTNTTPVEPVAKSEVKETEKEKEKPKKVSVNSKIKKAAKPRLGEKYRVEINEDMGKNDGGKIVLVRVQQDNITKSAADFETTNSLKKVFKIKEVNEITYFWEATLVDVKGKKTVETVDKIQMSKETAESIEWDNFSSKNLDVVADQYILSPVLE